MMGMKRLFSGFLMLIFILASCSKENKSIKETRVYDVNASENLKKIEVEIEGMTCEIGCARLIESKLSKTKGVRFVNVNFEKKRGIIEYDANILNENKIAGVIRNVAGGDIYRVVKSREIEGITDLR